MDQHPIQGGIDILLIATETGISSGLMGHLTCMQTSLYQPKIDLSEALFYKFCLWISVVSLLQSYNF